MKRAVAVTMLIMLFTVFSVTAFAGTSTGSGSTSGGASGTLTTNASLYCTGYMAAASTGINASQDHVTFATSVVLTYYNANGHKVSSNGSGTVSAGVSIGLSTATNAVSYHNVYGTTYWGNWSCTLTATP